MNPNAVLAAFDEQIRRGPGPHADDAVRAETDEGWRGVAWSDLTPDNADEKIAEQIRRFAGRSWEWKHYSHDQPADLPERLVAHGFAERPGEALLIAEIADLDLDVRPPEGVRLRPVENEHDVAAFVRIHDEVFGGDYSSLGRLLLDSLSNRPDTMAAVVATAAGSPIAAARTEFHEGTEFASLWGGGTLPGWRGKGVFRSLVAYRAALAKARGYRYLQVDAMPASRPILRRLGFVEVATTTPFTYG
jgi:GNAT superfamily N-acetyltransferase